jgi:hypothetical protein
MVASQWLLSVSLKPNGDDYPQYTLIDRRKQRSIRFSIRKHCLQKSVSEKLVMLRIMRGNFDHHFFGTWIGDRHMVVALDKDEYNNILERISGNARA